MSMRWAAKADWEPEAEELAKVQLELTAEVVAEPAARLVSDYTSRVSAVMVLQSRKKSNKAIYNRE